MKARRAVSKKKAAPKSKIKIKAKAGSKARAYEHRGSGECPSCGAAHFPGEDRCKRCLHSLMAHGIHRHKKGDKSQQVMMTAPIAELLTGKDLLVADEADTIQKVVKIFQKEKKDCVVVFKKKKLVGILSQRDILHKVAGKYKDLSKVTVGAVMTRRPEWVRAEDPIAYVVNKMAMGGFRHVPVINNDGTPASIITIRDVLRYLDRRHETESDQDAAEDAGRKVF